MLYTDAVQMLEAAREKCDPPTWYELAKRCGTHSGIVHSWRKREGAFTNEAAFVIADLLEMDPAEVIAIREVSREKDSDRRNRWMERLGKRVAMVSGILISSLTYPSHTEGSSLTSHRTSYSPRTTISQVNNYVSRLRRALQRLAQVLDGHAFTAHVAQ